jgi:hypothetical protein
MAKIGWNVVDHQAVLLARCIGCKSARPIQVMAGACLCSGCRRLMVDEVTHPILGGDDGGLVLCTSCYCRRKTDGAAPSAGGFAPR